MKKIIALITLIAVISASFALCVSAKEQMIADFDTTDASWSDATLETMTGVTGNACCRTLNSISMVPAIVCHSFGDAKLDIAEYANNADGYLDIQIYVDDKEEIETGEGCGHVELTSNALASGNCTWEIGALIEKSGWNHLKLKFADANVKDPDFNPAAIDSCRIFVYGYAFTLAVDDMKVVIPEGGNTEQGEEEQPSAETADFTAVAAVAVVAAGAVLVVSKKKAR